MADSSGSSSNRQFSLRHIKHETKMNSTLYSMLQEKNLVDVILCSESTNLSAHRLILSANSSYFKSLFISLDSNRCQIPVIVLKDVPLFDLKAILEFMYKGEVCVEEQRLSSVLKSAELLKVFGLTEVCLALRSRINNETITDTPTSAVSSGSGSNKRPRINEGIETTPQQSTPKSPNDLLSRLSTARFEIRPPISTSSPANRTNPQQLRSIIGTTTDTSNITTLVKNVILPVTQIHRSSHPIEVVSKSQNISVIKTVPTTVGTSVQPIGANTSKYSKSPNIVSTISGQKSTDSANIETNVETRSQLSSSTQTGHITETMSSSVASNSSTGVRSPVEILIDGETNDDNDTDIKPPIFELDQTIDKEKALIVLDIDSDSGPSKKIEEQNNQLTKIGPKVGRPRKAGLKSVSPISIKSRKFSTSSQSSLPPPPGYREVQRSNSRLLRNMIKPTASASGLLASKRKDSPEDHNPILKKEKQSVRIQQRIDKQKTLLSDNVKERGPEIECPSCGLKFNDEKKWDKHIRSAHLLSKT